MQVTQQFFRSCGLSSQRRNRYIQLVAQSSTQPNTPRILQTLNLRWSAREGYLLIQTDKPIYTPRQKGETASHAPCNHLALSFSFILFKKKTPLFNNDTAYTGRNVHVHCPITEVGKHFFFLVFFLGFSNSFFYGKGVTGTAYVRFGVIGENKEKVYIPGLKYQITVREQRYFIILFYFILFYFILITFICRPSPKTQGGLQFLGYNPVCSAIAFIPLYMPEQELTSVKFISSPYSVDLLKTKRYFVPNAPYEVLVCAVFFCYGSPASNLPVRFRTRITGAQSPRDEQMNSNNEGIVNYRINVAQGSSTLTIFIFPQLTAGAESPAEVTLTAKATKSPRGNYLIIESPKSYGLNIGETLTIDLKPIGSNAFTDIYYMVLSKGEIISVSSVQRGTLSAIRIPITPNLMPTFRVVAFYRLQDEIVSNSIWLEVVSRCEGKVYRLQPQSRLSLTINTDAKSFVSLSATDAAVYALNGKSRLTQGKVSEAMKSYDLGCTAGSGEDSLGIFADAGLSIRAGGQQSLLRKAHGCEENTSRKKRSLSFQLEIEKKIAKYRTPNQVKCCKGGIVLLRNARSCEERAKRIQNTECREVFLDCCRYAAKLRRLTWGSHGLARGEYEFLDDDVITLRRFFPESWLWQTFSVDQTFHLPDSITTWEIQAVSMSSAKGVCISEPFKVTVFQEFHISLRLPYSVKQFEQIELRPVLYNYQSNPLSVSVYLEPAEGICSPATLGPARKQKVEVPGNSAIPVPFVLVPMGASDIPITIVAVGEWGIGDKISKKLRVEKMLHWSNMELIFYHLLFGLDEHTKSVKISGELPPNAIPDGDFKMSVRLTGSVPADTLQSSLDPDGISSLLRVPKGCAEQTMVLMAPAFYAMQYLDKTEQWLHLKPESKEVALENLHKGYTKILTYRKANGSYGAWISTPSSTWLTAFVVKILSLTRIYQKVDIAGIQGSVQWILEQQQSDGSFTDSHPVYHREMQGGIGGLRGGVSLTAFVTIALTEALPFYEARSVSQSINQSINQKHILNNHFCFGLKFCCLVLGPPDSSVIFWLADGEHPAKVPSAISVETTSYALLYLVKQNDAARASKVAQWLTEQRNYGGGFKSTQDTVVALEALSSYWISTFKEEGNELTVSLTVPGKHFPTQISFGRSNDPVQEELQRKLIFSSLSFQVLKQFHVLAVQNNTCQTLGLEVTVSGSVRRNGMTGIGGLNISLCFQAPQSSRECVAFRAKQMVSVGKLQPASATIYDFYEPRLPVSCSSDYSTFPLLDNLCSDDVCQCAEGACPRLKRTLEDAITDETRMNFACYSPRVHYAFLVRVERESQESAFRVYEVKIKQALQFTTDSKIDVGQIRRFVVRAACKTRLAAGKEYLLMGRTETQSSLQGPQYLLDKNSWIEELPDPRRCKATQYRNTCSHLESFTTSFGINGCRI
uniref:Anaphylatoxin-like domain-containing protein n=1 Tax=Naja naja TaxID=35670 RepID=A0A8C6VA06_NAJNA